jgi:serine/threonine protein kinase
MTNSELPTEIPEQISIFTVKRLIGTGSFATVWLGEHSASGLQVAIKAVPTTSVNDPEVRTRFVRECTLMKQMDHPFICKLYQVLETQTHVFLIQEFVENGTLLSYVNRHMRLPELQARRYFSQLLSALEYLHTDRMVAHRDIKAENVLLDTNFNIRLIDFGLSHAFSANQPTLHTACGSPAYASPEMILGRPYTQAADIWSAGVLLYAMVTGELPFDHPSDVQSVLRQIVRDEPQYPDILTSSLIDLLKRLLAKSPDDRIDIEHIKTHPWFSQSEYVRIFQIRFSSDEWHMRGVERVIIDELEKIGIDTRAVAEALLLGECTPQTVVYAMLHRRTITERIRETMDSLKGQTGTLLVSSTIRSSINTASDRVTLAVPGGPLGFRRGASIAVRRKSAVDRPVALPPRKVGLLKRPKSTTMQ